jgi:hypothetical protein
MLRRILLIIGYLLLIILLVGFTVVLVAYGNDYSYDFQTHKVIQKGHIILDTLPTGLRVTADGRLLTKKTPYQAAYTVGMHEFSVSAPGYYTWQKNLQVIAGQVNLAMYAVLVPRHPVETIIDSRLQITAEAMTPDSKHLAYITGGLNPAVYTVNVANPTPVKVYVPKVATATNPAETVTSVEWSHDGSHLLITGTANGQPEELLEAAGGGSPVNLTAQYGFTFSGVQFSDNNWQQLYWIAPDGLRRVDVGAQSVSDVLATNVTQFWPIPGRVLYIQQIAGEPSLWDLDGNDHSQRLIDALADSPTYSIDYSTWLGNDEIAIVPSATGTGTLYTGLFGSTPTALTIAHSVVNASFSPDGHLIAFYSPTNIVTYDLNQSQLQNHFIAYDMSGLPGSLTALSWWDSYHMLQNRSGRLYWSEYDGSNRVNLGLAYSTFGAYNTPDQKSLVTFKSQASGVELLELRIVK